MPSATLVRSALSFSGSSPLFREALRTYLSVNAELTIGYRGEHCDSGSQSPEGHGCIEIVILDAAPTSVANALSTIQNAEVGAPLVFLAHRFTEDFARIAVRRRPTGLVQLDGPADEIFDAIRAVKRGRSYFSPALSEIGFTPIEVAPPNPIASQFSPREMAILTRAASGKTTRKIAEELSMSVKSIDYIRSRLFRKLGIHRCVELTRFAIREGLIPP